MAENKAPSLDEVFPVGVARDEAIREAGRREVLLEIAAAGEPYFPFQPIDDGRMCVWCEAFSLHQQPIPHQPFCPWLKVQAVK